MTLADRSWRATPADSEARTKAEAAKQGWCGFHGLARDYRRDIPFLAGAARWESRNENPPSRRFPLLGLLLVSTAQARVTSVLEPGLWRPAPLHPEGWGRSAEHSDGGQFLRTVASLACVVRCRATSRAAAEAELAMALTAAKLAPSAQVLGIGYRVQGLFHIPDRTLATVCPWLGRRLYHPPRRTAASVSPIRPTSIPLGACWPQVDLT